MFISGSVLLCRQVLFKIGDYSSAGEFSSMPFPPRHRIPLLDHRDVRSSKTYTER